MSSVDVANCRTRTFRRAVLDTLKVTRLGTEASQLHEVALGLNKNGKL